MIREINVVTGVEIQRDMTAEEQAVVDAYVAPVKTWEENRQAEYPTIAELVVALYDTDDKAAIEKRRSDVKAKYPKP